MAQRAAERCQLLVGKVAVITGAAGGFGTGLATAMAQHGAQLALLDIDREALASEEERLTARGTDALSVRVDLRDEDDIRSVLGHVIEHFGRVDVLVNNAAILREKAIDDVTRRDWDESLAVNVRAPYLLCQLVAPVMTSHGGGAIVNVTSIATRTGLPGRSLYAITKAALRSMTEQMALEWGPRNVRSNAMFLGGISWTMKGLAEVDRSRVDNLPLRRLATKEELANAAVFLASDLASYINGIELAADGGRFLTPLSNRAQPAPFSARDPE